MWAIASKKGRKLDLLSVRRLSRLDEFPHEALSLGPYIILGGICDIAG
jgi:hypothetical protein